jgi:hypothetical protein
MTGSRGPERAGSHQERQRADLLARGRYEPEAGFDRRLVPTAVLVRRHKSATSAASRAGELQNYGKSLRFGQRGGGASG